MRVVATLRRKSPGPHPAPLPLPQWGPVEGQAAGHPRGGVGPVQRKGQSCTLVGETASAPGTETVLGAAGPPGSAELWPGCRGWTESERPHPEWGGEGPAVSGASAQVSGAAAEGAKVGAEGSGHAPQGGARIPGLRLRPRPSAGQFLGLGSQEAGLEGGPGAPGSPGGAGERGFLPGWGPAGSVPVYGRCASHMWSAGSEDRGGQPQGLLAGGRAPGRSRVPVVGCSPRREAGYRHPVGASSGGVPCGASEAQGCPAASSGAQLLRKGGLSAPQGQDPTRWQTAVQGCRSHVPQDPGGEARPHAKKGP